MQQFSPQCIFKYQRNILSIINSIAQQHHASNKVVISLMSDKQKMNHQDNVYLKQLCGNENEFDFSGVNEFTKNYINDYQDLHFRPKVAW